MATATAISSLVRAGIAPSAIAARSKARKPSQAAGASVPNFESFLRLAASYIAILLRVFSSRSRQHPGRAGRPSLDEDRLVPVGFGVSGSFDHSFKILARDCNRPATAIEVVPLREGDQLLAKRLAP